VPDYLNGDHYWLRRILSNLVSNAVKFTAKGHINIRISLANENHWALQVTDTGLGIPEELQTAIFDPFYKGVTTTSGAGLGLSIVREIVEKMNGHIELESAPGKGSTFTVYLPLHTQEV